jgi:hypothetical protein
VLADSFRRRRIAVGVDRDGQVILVRPDSVVCDGRGDAARRAVIASLVARFDPEQAERIGGQDRPKRILDIIKVDLSASLGSDEESWNLDAVHSFMDAARDEGLAAEYNHVVIGGQNVTGSPLGAQAHWAGEMAFPAREATGGDGSTVLLTTAEPATRPAFLRAPLALAGRQRPRVLVVDSGIRTVRGDGADVEHPDIAESVKIFPNVFVTTNSALEVDDEDERDDDGTGTLDFEAGHGTFISGIVRQICPDAEVRIAGVLSSFGEGDVAGVLDSIDRLLSEVGPVDVVVMSFGTNLVDEDPGIFGRGLSTLLDAAGAVGVAAAGNQQTCRPYYPAAFADVIGVGGLAADGKAWFTNFGGWVDACAPAVDVVSSFFLDFTEQVQDDTGDVIDGRHYDGWARWSGTSFAAPKVAALIAQEMYLNGVTAKDAWRRLTSHKQLRYPDLGIVFNV